MKIEFNTPTFEEELNKFIEHDDVRGIACLIDKNLYILGLEEKDDEKFKTWLERARPNLIEQIKKANIEFQKMMNKYIGNATIEPTEELLIEKLEAIEPECVESWSEFLLDLPNKTIGELIYWMNIYIINSDEIAHGGGFLCRTIDDNDETVFHEEIYNFYKQILPIALVYLNTELLNRLEQLEVMTSDEKTSNNKDK